MASKYVDGDQEYLRDRQYGTRANLSQRVNIHDRFGINPYGWHLWVFDQLADAGLAGSVLDVGAGLGDLWLRNRDRVPSGTRLTLVDSSPAMVEGLAKRLADSGLDASTAVVDVLALDDDRAHDVVVCNHVLYHVPDRADAVRRLARAVADDGYVAISTNGARHMVELDELAARHIDGVDVGAFGESFGLESGYAHLVGAFDEVVMRRYRDGLVIDDADAIVGYVASLYSEGTDDQLAALRAEVVERLADGPLTVTKDPGLFLCRRPRR